MACKRDRWLSRAWLHPFRNPSSVPHPRLHCLGNNVGFISSHRLQLILREKSWRVSPFWRLVFRVWLTIYGSRCKAWRYIGDLSGWGQLGGRQAEGLFFGHELRKVCRNPNWTPSSPRCMFVHWILYFKVDFCLAGSSTLVYSTSPKFSLATAMLSFHWKQN